MFMRCRPLAAAGVRLIPTRGAAHRQLNLQPATEWLEVLVPAREAASREADRYAGLLESARRGEQRNVGQSGWGAVCYSRWRLHDEWLVAVATCRTGELCGFYGQAGGLPYGKRWHTLLAMG